MANSEECAYRPHPRFQRLIDSRSNFVAMTVEMITNKIHVSFPNAKVKASDMTGGGDHWQLIVETEEFRGKSLVEQHQLVYKALGDWMKQDIHALALTTRSPE